jgi:hypothetical protein
MEEISDLGYDESACLKLPLMEKNGESELNTER